MFCGNCGATLNESEFICLKCGSDNSEYFEKTVSLKETIKPDLNKTLAIYGERPDIQSAPTEEKVNETKNEIKDNPYAVYKNQYIEEQNSKSEKVEEIEKIEKTVETEEVKEPKEQSKIKEVKIEDKPKEQSNKGLIIGIIASSVVLIAGITTLILLLI